MTSEIPSGRPGSTPWLQNYVFPGYLTFSVCFYSLRFLFGWGSALTTSYESDMPAYLAVLKDLAWVGLLGATLFSRSFGRAIEGAKRHSSIYLVLAAFCGWMVFCSGIHIMFFYESLGDSLLNNIRFPLEYVPAALLAPAFIGNWARFGNTWKYLNRLAIVFGAFELSAVVGGWKQTGFDWGGLTVRFGGILGSPNDWGIYSAGAIVAIVALRKTRVQLLGFVPALLLTQSRSALAGLVTAFVPLIYRADIRRIGIRLFIALLVLGVAVSVFVPITSSDVILPEHIGLDESATIRLDQIGAFQDEFRDLDNFSALLFGVRYFHIESFYLALVVRGGIPAFTLYVTAIGMSAIRGWRMRKDSSAHLVALCVVVLISTASFFIPYPDVYPTNFYLWLAIGVIWMEPLSRQVNTI